jgi:hypothetical protein
MGGVKFGFVFQFQLGPGVFFSTELPKLVENDSFCPFDYCILYPF